jgi:hypothetical protein
MSSASFGFRMQAHERRERTSPGTRNAGTVGVMPGDPRPMTGTLRLLAGKPAAADSAPDVTARRPWRRALPASYGLLIGYGAMAAMTAVAVAAGGTRHPAVALALLAATACAVATRTTAPTAFGVGAMGWLFYDGFVVGRHADLGWHGTVSMTQFAVLTGAAGCVAALSGLRTRSPSGRPAAREPTAPVVNQAHARAVRRARSSAFFKGG